MAENGPVYSMTALLGVVCWEGAKALRTWAFPSRQELAAEQDAAKKAADAEEAASWHRVAEMREEMRRDMELIRKDRESMRLELAAVRQENAELHRKDTEQEELIRQLKAEVAQLRDQQAICLDCERHQRSGK